MPEITIGILAYNGEKYFDRCFPSLFAQDFKDLEIIVLDNASPNNDAEVLKQKFGDKIKVIRSEKNLGFGGGHSKIIRESSSKYYLCLNQDMFFEPNFASALLEAIKKDQSYGSATGKLYRWDFANDAKTNYIDTVGITALKSHHFFDEGQGKLDQGQYDEMREIFAPSGAAVLYLRSALEEVNLFDKNMFMYKEDIDLGYRLQWAGWKSIYTPSAVAYHDRTVGKNSDRKNRTPAVRKWSYLNHLILVNKNFSDDYSWAMKVKTKFNLFLRKMWARLIERDTLAAEKEFKEMEPLIMEEKKNLIRRASPSDMEKLFK